MKSKTELAVILSQIEENAEAIDGIANGILSAIKMARARTLEKFNDMVSFAYETNGWSQRVGRPAVGSTERPAPDAVKMYVSNVRAAYRLELDVTSFDTMGALRAAIREARCGTSAESAAVLRGVQVSSESTMNGALMHDVVVLDKQLPEDEQDRLERSLRRLLNKFIQVAPPMLVSSYEAAANYVH